jgi:ubiquinone/menaquinone biosynthesis C-methylase UbiE
VAELPEEIRRFYEAGLEDGRLQEGSGVLERVRTQDVLQRVLPRPPARVLDVGGGTGPYTRWLAGLGYEAHLVDPVASQVEHARRQGGGIASARVGDARHLEDADASADAVLLLGPLYHLQASSDRLAALREAARVVRPGGVVVAAAISRFASLLDGLVTGALDDPAFRAIVARDLEDGHHLNTTGRLEYFTTAYFHRPEELADEGARAGLAVEGVRAVEGPAWLMADFAARFADPERQAHILELLRGIETEPALLAVSAHLLLVARRP